MCRFVPCKSVWQYAHHWGLLSWTNAEHELQKFALRHVMRAEPLPFFTLSAGDQDQMFGSPALRVKQCSVITVALHAS